MNIQQTRNAQNAIRNAISICESKGGLSEAATVANQAWIDAGEAYPLPVGEYRRYSWLMADLSRMQVQLADQLRDLELAAGLPVDEETGVDLREHSGNSIAADHAEALEINAAVDEAVFQSEVYADSDRYDQICNGQSIDRIRMRLLAVNRYNPSFIISMMVAVSRLAKKARAAAKVRHQEMLARCATATTEQISKEIPF